MSDRKFHETLGDYVAVAISPPLIMLLVGSLLWFLLSVFYHGPFDGRLRWVLFWFVVAIVLIARISMEIGSERASIYALALGFASLLVIVKIVHAVFVPAILLGIAWWCANRLTWDCTYLGGEKAAAGEGLLGAVGWDDELPDEENKAEPQRPHEDVSSTPVAADDSTNSWDTRLKNWLNLLSLSDEARRGPRGISVVYFSVAALPIFGVGQGIIAAASPEKRAYSFGLLCVYLAAALGLLCTTSFLSIRQYLRSRRLPMPPVTAAAWIGTASVLAVAILLLAILLPKPQAEYSVPSLARNVADEEWRASKWSLLRDNAAKSDDEGSGSRPAGDNPLPDAESENAGTEAEGKGESQPGSTGNAPGEANEEENADGQSGNESGGSAGSNDNERGNQSGQSGEMPTEQSSDSQGGGDESSSSESDTSLGDSESSSGGTPSTVGESSDGQSQSASTGSQGEDDRNSSGAGSASSDATADNSSQQQTENIPPIDESEANEVQQAEQQREPEKPRTARRRSLGLGGWLFWLARWAVLLALIVAAILFFLRDPQRALGWVGRWLAAVAAMWRDLMRRLTGRSRDRAVEVVDPLQTLRPFSSYPNPFGESSPVGNRPEDLVRYSFEALEAWSAERDVERPNQQTSAEFCGQLARRYPELAAEVRQLGAAYALVAYGEGRLDKSSIESLRSLWTKLSAAARAPARHAS